MSVDTYRTFTDFSWNDEYRPTVNIYPGNKATLHIGSDFVSEISGESEADLKGQLESFAEIFSAAAESLGDNNIPRALERRSS